VQEDTVLWDTAATQRRLTVFRAYGSGAISGTLSIDFSGETQTGAHWSLIELAFSDDTGGTNGSVAAVQSVPASGSSTTPSTTLAAFGDTDNATVGFVAHTGTGAVTAGSGFGRVNNLGFNGMALAAEFVSTNDTSVDATVANSAWGIIGIEVKAAADPTIPTGLPDVMGDSTGSSIFVSTGGNDTTGDGSIGNPYLSISKALTVVGASGIIEVRYDSGAAHTPSGTAGTAAGERFTCSVAGKSREEPVTIRTYPADLASGKALINGEFYVGSSTNEMVGNYKFQNLVIKKRTAMDNPSSTAGDYGVRVEISRNVEVSDCEITENNQGGILVGGSAAFMGVEGVQIFRNRIHTVGSSGANHNANLKHDHCVYWGGGSADSVYGGAVYNNLLYVTRFGFCLHPWGSGGTGFSFKHSIIAYNTCYDSDTESASSGNSLSIMGGGSSGAVDNVYTSNILMKSGTLGTSYGLEWDGAGTGNLFKNLLIYEVRDGDFEAAVSSHGTLSNNITGEDPLLTDPDNGDFHLSSAASPAVGAGEAAYKPDTDFYGEPRVTADIGAAASPADTPASVMWLGTL
jgi:hypothetical protein